MNKRLIFIVIAVGALVLASLACSASTANISSAILTADGPGGTETTTFTPDQASFYCIVALANAPDDTKVKAVWYTVDDVGTATQIVDSEIVGSASPITFKATNDGLWPVGKYKVEVYMNDKLDRTLEFTVQE
ncbi:MAG: hypothetical protein NT121_01115 [Chloroflexi bacterium]|nr:hypothetical protein [Chloroflexota bacterium]